MTTRGVAISVFSGVGGLDLGAEKAGFEVRAAVERDVNAADTMRKNFPHLAGSVICADILDVPTTEIMAAAGLSRRERPDLLIGGPPCTPFSKSGFWLDWKRAGRDPAAGLLQEFTRVLREARPRGFVLENVSALTFDNRASRPAFQRLLAEADAAGYKHAWKVLNAADFGVAQSRQRLFVTGVLKTEKTTPGLPVPGFGGTRNRRVPGDPGKPHVTAGQALEGLTASPEPSDEVAGRYGHLLPGIPPGGNYLHYTAERGHPAPLFRWRSRYWSFLLKLDPDRPSPTIQAQPGPYTGPFHWENRRLRIPELKRLFGFPDEFQFTGSRNSVQSQIGNSVPPELSRAVMATLFGNGAEER